MDKIYFLFCRDATTSNFIPGNSDNLQELLETHIAIVSVGHKRDHTIVIEDPIHGPKRVLQKN